MSTCRPSSRSDGGAERSGAGVSERPSRFMLGLPPGRRRRACCARDVAVLPACSSDHMARWVLPAAADTAPTVVQTM